MSQAEAFEENRATESCDICLAPTHWTPLAGGGQVRVCERCGHVERVLERCPAHHRALAFGGEPVAERVRSRLTYRELQPRDMGEKVFEIGYGDGSLLRRFHDDGFVTGGVDPGQLDLGVDPVVRNAGGLLSGEVEEVDLSGVEADTVIGIHVIEHVADVHKTMAAAAAALRPGGVLQLMTPAADSLGLRRYGAAWWMLEDPTHVRFFTARSLEELARGAGFVDVRVTRPLWDSLSVDAASWVRRRRPRQRPGGVLGEPTTRLLGVLSLPFVVAARILRPRHRPTLRLWARTTIR